MLYLSDSPAELCQYDIVGVCGVFHLADIFILFT